MSTIFVVFGFGLMAIVIMAKIPGLEHTVRPIIDLVFTFLKAFLENAVSWSIWLFKVILDAHLELAKHLIYSAEDMDPSIEFTENQ